MELVIKHDSNVKITICKDETIISTVVSKGSESSSIVHTPNSIVSKVGSC